MISISPRHEEGSRGLVVLHQGGGPDGATVACRSLKAKHVNPHQLSLARCNLTQCFHLEGEEDLRLLNLSHNQLQHVAHLDHLTSLVYLDLSRNQLQAVAGLAALQNLRVLMLGRNAISDLVGIEALQQLEVLDIHSNHLASLAALPQLPSLRVANLSSNAVTHLCPLTTMTNLLELNLRHNAISSLEAGRMQQQPSTSTSSTRTGGACALPQSLCRLSLAQNQLQSAAALAPLRQLAALTELSVDGNPFTQHLPPLVTYRAAALECCPLGLVKLDIQQVSPEERVFMLNGERQRKLQAMRMRLEQETAEATLAVHGNVPQQLVQPISQRQQHQHGQCKEQQAQQSRGQAVVAPAAEQQADSMPTSTGHDAGAEAAAAPATSTAHAGRHAQALHAAEEADDAEVMELIQRLATTGLSPSGRPGSPAAGTGLQAARQHQHHQQQHEQTGKHGIGNVAHSASAVQDAQRRSVPGNVAAAGPGSVPIHSDSLKRRFKAKHMKLTDRFHEDPPPPPPDGIQFDQHRLDFDGRVLALAGEVLFALKSPSYAAASQVSISHVDVTEVLASRLVPALAALPRLNDLTLENVGLATLQQLHPLAKLTRLASLTIRDCPINALVLLRPYVVCRLPALLQFNDIDISQEEYEEALAMFGPLDATLAAAMALPAQRAALTAAGFLAAPGTDVGTANANSTAQAALRPFSASTMRSHAPTPQSQPNALLDVLAQSTGAALPKRKARQQAERFTQSLLGEAVAVQVKLDELEQMWPVLAKQYIAEGWDGAYKLPS